MVNKSINGNQTQSLADRRAEREALFNRILEETYRKANPNKFKVAKTLQVSDIHIEEYDADRARNDTSYRFYWRKRFSKVGLELPPELQIQKRGRVRINEENAEKLIRFKARKKLEEAGEPVPPELQRRSHINKKYIKDTE